MKIRLTLKSRNTKTGPIPVSTTSAKSCPPSCALKGACYAKSGPLALVWKQVESIGLEFDQFCQSIAALHEGQLWRHNQAGDLPGVGERVNRSQLRQLVKANTGKRGFTYSHKRDYDAIAEANANGFTVNVSCETLEQADNAVSQGLPAVVVLHDDSVKALKTPNGNTVALCPAQYLDTNCKDCGLCQRANRKVIVGFAAHGVQVRKAQEAIA